MKLALIFGASSYEHEISIVSAITILNKLKNSFEIVPIFIDANRDFYLIDVQDMKSKFFASKEYLKKAKKLELTRSAFEAKSLFGSKRVEFDVAINLVHGRDGEDGKLAAIFEFFDINFIGPRVEGSVISYNKLFTKMFAKELGINVIDYVVLKEDGKKEIPFDFPIIIKPLRLGSSIGVSVVKEKSELDYALDVAFEFDSEVLVEPFIKDIKEYNLAGAKGSKWHISIVEEPKKEEFLDFDKKYLDFSRDERVNEANISEELKKELEAVFKKIYEPLFRGAIIRCDFFVKDNSIYLNEINPIPGSMANYLFSDFEEVVKDVATNLHKEKD
ncbi:MAG: D-alanine--D-alanine ligase, partial [Epsilonproteobacteria bacterium]|nr:D-alanine--D-alanine ligase [Campylobacterota bacterium]